MTVPEPPTESFVYEQLVAMRAMYPEWQIRIACGMWIAERLMRDASVSLRQITAEALRTHIHHHNASLRQLENQVGQASGANAVDQ